MEPATKRRKLSSGSSDSRDVAAKADSQQDNRHSLFVRSLPASVTTERLIEHFSQSYPLKHATIVLDPKTKASRGFGFVTFTDAEDARQALAEFDNSALDGRRIKVEVAEARHRDVEDRIDGAKTRSVNAKGEELRAKRQREQQNTQPPKLIVRNLPWSIKTAEDLTKLFLSYGKVKHAVVPKLPAKKDAQAGFGIVIIRGKKNAERALQGVNGKVVDGRTLAVDWAVDKETWQQAQKGETSQPKAGDDEAKINDVAEDQQDKPSESSNEEANEEGDGRDKHVDTAEASASQRSDNSDWEGEENQDDAEQQNDDLDASDISSIAAESETPTTATATASKFNAETTTIFIRNLPYDVDDETLFDHFKSSFGPIRYARVVYDPETERSRGTAFVCFRHEDDAKSCVKNCPKPESASSDSKQKSNQSILQDTSADPTGAYTLSHRLLHVTRALPKNEADRRASESANERAQKQQSDKRRLYLLSEGTVSPSSSLGQSLSKADLDVRSASLKQRQKLVKSNPNLGLSLTRLSIRNLPRWIDAKALKQLAREAVVGFASDVKSGLREPISKEELARDGEAGRKADAERKEKGKGVVKQAKIVYESEITGGKVGEGKGGRSRGYGFVEYWNHRHALMGLRWLNGHLLKKTQEQRDATDHEERGKRLIVEFAIENAQVVQRRDDRERRVQERKAWQRPDGEVENGPGEGGRKRKRDEKDEGGQAMGKGKGKGKGKNQKKDEKDEKTQDEKNKIAARNRIIAQKRQKRRARKGKA